MSRLAQFGNDLYTGDRSFDFVGKRRLWYIIIGVLVLISVAFPLLRGFNLGIEFTGGSQFQIATVQNTDVSVAEEAVHSVVPDAEVHTTVVGGSGLRIQTGQMTSDETDAVVTALAESYDVPESEVATSFIGPSWGQDVTRQAVVGLIVFLGLAAVGMALYFRTWKMSIAAIVSLLADLIITVGVYSITGFELTPAALIGVLTILSYSLYDTVVVFDKIRENTSELGPNATRTYGEAVNLAVNQTLVRSINTSVVAALPVAAILFIGAFAFGADTLRDISLALLIGIIVGTWSTVFLAAPMYAQMRESEPAIAEANRVTLAAREANA